MAKGDKKRGMIIQIGDSTFDRIKAHHIYPEAYPLSDKEQAQLDRWRAAFTMLMGKNSKLQVVNTLIKSFALSTSQAYADVRNAESLYGSVLKADKEAQRAMWMDWALDYLKRAQLKGDLKAEGKALELFAKYGGFAAEDDALFDEKAVTNKIEFGVSEKVLQRLTDAFQKGGAVNFNDLNVIDIDSEEVKDGTAD